MAVGIHRLCWNCGEVIDTSDDQVTWRYIPGGGSGDERPYDLRTGRLASAPPAWAAHRGTCLDTYKAYLDAKVASQHEARDRADANIARLEERHAEFERKHTQGGA